MKPPTPTVVRCRAALRHRLFPGGAPELWSPTLTHFAAAHRFDRGRIAAHLACLARHVRGVLVPGSTGEGWEMSDTEVRRLLAHVLDLAPRLRLRVLIGVLKTEAAAAAAAVRDLAAWVRGRTGERDTLNALAAAHVAGFTVCPPRGADLGQAQLRAGVERILRLELPVALYQLPQVTHNELSPATVAALAARWPNFLLFKDTSGRDRVALSGRDLGGVFLVRGAEGDYARWPKTAGGPYDGFLLSSTNALAAPLVRMLAALRAGRAAEAEALSRRIERTIGGAFAAVAGVTAGNAFANANKILDHWMAWGSDRGAVAPPPRLIGGTTLPAPALATARQLLATARWLPARGYLGAAH